MTADQYLQTILQREAVDTGIFSPVRGVQAKVLPIIQKWAGNNLVSVTPSGSFAKGTANQSGTDIADQIAGAPVSKPFGELNRLFGVSRFFGSMRIFLTAARV